MSVKPRIRACQNILTGYEDTKGNKELVCRCHATTDLRWGRLGLVHRHSSAESANSETTNKTTDGDLDPGRERGNLDNNTDDKYEALCGHGPSTTEVIRSPFGQSQLV